MGHRFLRLGGIGLAGLTAAVHVVVGTYDTLLPLLGSDVAPMIKGTFHACWHFLSVFLVFSVWSFVKESASAPSLAWLWIAFAACFVVAGFATDGIAGLLLLPQWIFLGLAGGLMVLSFRTPS